MACACAFYPHAVTPYICTHTISKFTDRSLYITALETYIHPGKLCHFTCVHLHDAFIAVLYIYPVTIMNIFKVLYKIEKRL